MPTPLPWPLTPMLAKPAEVLPKEDGRWAYEMKWDGIRLVAKIEGGSITLATRNRIDATGRYPELRALATQIEGHSVLLDGELVAFDDVGRPSFEALQQRMGLEGGKRVASRRDVPVAYALFDLLYLDGESLMPLPFERRRARLEALALDGPHWMTTPFSAGNGEGMLATSIEHGFEGIVAKRLDSAYEVGKRPGTWLKLKNQRRQEFVIGGWVPGEGKRTAGLARS